MGEYNITAGMKIKLLGDSITHGVGGHGLDEATELSRLDFGVKTAALSDAYVYVKLEKIIQVADCEI